MITLSKEQVRRLHSLLIEQTGGMDGIRDEGLLGSALASAFHSFDDTDLYPSVVAKIARIAYSLVCNHAFVDGNKRIGTYVMLVLLDLNRMPPIWAASTTWPIGIGRASAKSSKRTPCWPRMKNTSPASTWSRAPSRCGSTAAARWITSAPKTRWGNRHLQAKNQNQNHPRRQYPSAPDAGIALCCRRYLPPPDNRARGCHISGF